MTQWNENNDPANQDDYPDTGNDRVQDTSNADAANFNADEQEQAVNERLSAETNTDELADESNDEETNIDNSLGEELGGVTNLSLDQLKKERDPEGSND